MPGIYLEPVGLLYGATAQEAVSLGAALPLTGSVTVAFGAVRLWEGEPGSVKHAIVRTSTIQAIDEPAVKALLDRIMAPRAAVAGIAMDGPRIMGVVNATPDSFSDGGEHFEASLAIEHARKLAGDGADFIDIGAESSRPGAAGVTLEEELQRLLPVLQGLNGFGVPISVDTRKPDVMRAAAGAGASMFNDISALAAAEDSLSTAAALKLPVVLLHSQGNPETMQDNPLYMDAAIEVYDYLENRIEAAVAAGLPRECMIADPGIGFGKTLAHNLRLLDSIGMFHGLGVPLLVGASRKSFLQKLTGNPEPKARVAGSIAVALDAVAQGVQIVRVHDVQATREAFQVWNALRAIPNTATDTQQT